MAVDVMENRRAGRRCRACWHVGQFHTGRFENTQLIKGQFNKALGKERELSPCVFIWGKQVQALGSAGQRPQEWSCRVEGL